MSTSQFDDELDLNDPELARNFLLFYLFETWEKLIQINAFVTAREHKRSQRRWATISNFSDVLNHLTRELDKSAVPYCKRLINGEEIIYDDFVEVVIKIKHVLEALLNLHQKLNILTGKSENQVTYDFIRKLAADTTGTLPQQHSWLPYIPSIALTDSYNFIEYDLRNILSAELQVSGFEPLPPQSRNVVLALPKAEAENPLMWTILAHETAHTMINSYKILEEIITRTPGYEKADGFSRKVYRNWSLEICADLIALRLLGPSYFFSFTSMGLLLDPPKITADHPPFIDRVGIMAKVLKNKHSEWVVSAPDTIHTTFTEQELIPFFLKLSHYKVELWSLPKYRKFFLSNSSDAKALVLKPDADLILDVINRVHVPVSKLSSPKQLASIFRTLSTGQPVSSQFSGNLDKDKFQTALHMAKNADELYALLPPPEKALTLSTILACGWMLKIYSNYDDLLEKILAKESLMETKELYKKIIARRNELLQSSLSRAFMMQMYWRWRDIINE